MFGWLDGWMFGCWMVEWLNGWMVGWLDGSNIIFSLSFLKIPSIKPSSIVLGDSGP